MNYLQRKLFRRLMCGILTTVSLCTLLHSGTVIASSSSDNDQKIVTTKEIIIEEENNNIATASNVSDLFYMPGDLFHMMDMAEIEPEFVVEKKETILVETAEENILETEAVIVEEETVLTEEEKWTSVIYVEEPYTKYVDVDSVLNVRIEPVTERDNIIGGLYYGEAVTVLGTNEYYTEWTRIEYKDKEAYVHTDYLVDEEEINFSRARSRETMNTSWTGEKLNSVNGRIAGPSGNETYYNLPMDKVVYYMNQLGYDYEVWTREDGVKMFGDYVMIAANLSTRPKGSLVETSLGTGMVVDTGAFVNWDPTGIDIAVTWR